MWPCQHSPRFCISPFEHKFLLLLYYNRDFLSPPKMHLFSFKSLFLWSILSPRFCYIRVLLKQYWTFFLCKNMVDFNEVRLHEAILKLHTHARNFSRLSIAWVDVKQHYLIQMLFAIHWRYWPAGKNHGCVWMFKVTSFNPLSLKFTRFLHKKIGDFSNRPRT